MDGMGRFPKAPAPGPRLGGSPAITSGTGYPWVDGDVLYAADLNAAFAEAFAADDIAGPAEAAALNSVGRNLIHNPLFNVAQRGVGPFTTNGLILDRWGIFTTGGSTFSAGIQALNDTSRAQIGDEAAQGALGITVTGAAGSTQVYQRIEGVTRLSGKTVTLSFWANSNVASFKVGASLDLNFAAGSSTVGAAQLVTLPATTTLFARSSITFTLASAAGKTLDASNNIQLNLWLSGNVAGAQSGYINIWGVQLEIGSVATPLEKPDPRYDLANCERFFATGYFTLSGNAAVGVNNSVIQPFHVLMRSAPTITPSPSTQINITGQNLGASGAYGMQVFATGAANGGFIYSGTFTASADL